MFISFRDHGYDANKQSVPENRKIEKVMIKINFRGIYHRLPKRADILILFSNTVKIGCDYNEINT